MRSAEDLAAWGRLDDVIMGGRSSSGLAPADGGAAWSGELITDGGGFCGTRTQARLPHVLHYEHKQCDGGFSVALRSGSWTSPLDVFI